MTSDDPVIGHPECPRRLDVIQFAQLERLAAQQTAQAGPAGHAEDHAQQEQTRIRPFARRLEPVLMAVDNTLQDQHGSGNQQHAGNRIERRVQILDDIVHPAAQITREDAEQECEWQHDQRRERTDDQTGADALECQVKHILADLVRAQHVISGGQDHHRHEHEKHHSIGDEHLAPRHFRMPFPYGRPGIPHAVPMPMRKPECHAEQQDIPRQDGDRNAGDYALDDVGSLLGRRVLQMRATVCQPRKHARLAAVRQFHGLLGEQISGQWRGIGLFLLAFERGGNHVEHGHHVDRIIHLTRGGITGQERPEM